ncbi:MAG TPA: hypothetical protein VGE42_10855, partial [Candidatus Dormibacteraeota bacterium]
MTAHPLEVSLVGTAATPESRPASAWPEQIPDPPRPGSSSGTLAGYTSWLSGAAEVLRRRVEANGAEL